MPLTNFHDTPFLMFSFKKFASIEYCFLLLQFLHAKVKCKPLNNKYHDTEDKVHQGHTVFESLTLKNTIEMISRKDALYKYYMVRWENL